MAQYLYRITPNRIAILTEGPTTEEAQCVDEHFRYLETLMHEGVVILAGRTLTADHETFGIVIFNADSKAAARDVMQNDPAVANGVMAARLFPYRVALISEQNAISRS